MSSDANEKRSQDALELMHGRGAQAFLTSHERCAAENREHAAKARFPLLRWFYTRQAQRAERWAERCREQIAKAEHVKSRGGD